MRGGSRRARLVGLGGVARSPKLLEPARARLVGTIAALASDPATCRTRSEAAHQLADANASGASPGRVLDLATGAA